jgi:hypothetical protein
MIFRTIPGRLSRQNVSLNTIVSIQNTLEEGGVEFIGTPDHQPGVRLK